MIVHILVKDNKVPAIKNTTLGKARVIKQRCRYLIALVVKNQSFYLSGRKKEGSTSLIIRRYFRIKFTNIYPFPKQMCPKPL